MKRDFEEELVTQIPHLQRYAHSLVLNLDTAEDLVQDCLEKAIKYRLFWRMEGSMRSWLFRILHNLIMNYFKREKIIKFVEIDESLENILIASTNIEISLELKQILRIILKLPQEQQSVLMLIAVEGFSYIEASRILGVKIGTIMSRLSRARQTLFENIERIEKSKPELRVISNGK